MNWYKIAQESDLEFPDMGDARAFDRDPGLRDLVKEVSKDINDESTMKSVVTPLVELGPNDQEVTIYKVDPDALEKYFNDFGGYQFESYVEGGFLSLQDVKRYSPPYNTLANRIPTEINFMFDSLAFGGEFEPEHLVKIRDRLKRLPGVKRVEVHETYGTIAFDGPIDLE